MDNQNFIDVFSKSVEKITNSDVFLSLVTENYMRDALCALQLGVAIQLDKPIFLIVQNGTVVPKKLEIVADQIFYFNDESEIQNIADEVVKLMGGKTHP